MPDTPSFEIKISDKYGPASYKADIISLKGKMSTTFQFPLKKQVIEATLADFRHNLQTTTLRSAQDGEYMPQIEGALTPEQLGTALFKSVFQPEVLELYKASRQQAKLQGQQSLPIIFNINPQASDLINLPWEFLCDTSESVRGQFLAFDKDTPIIRRWLRTTPVYLSYDPPLRVLLVSANPAGSSLLNVQREHHLVSDKLTNLNQGEQNKVKVDYLSAISLPKLKQIVRDEKMTPHIIHFMGHGGLGNLLLEDREGGQKSVSEESLAIVLRNAPSLRLVVLNACDTAQADFSAQRLLGVAQSLADASVPAVVAMQFAVSDDAALTFAEEFYQVIVEGRPIDAAITWGRIAIQNEFADSATKEWATPVLYLQAPDGNILTDLLGEQQKTHESRQKQDEITGQIEVKGQKDDQSAASKTEQMRREAEEITAQIEHLQKLRREHIRRLREREVQAAKYGINVDPHITLEISDIRAEINKIDAELKALDPEITFTEIIPPPTFTRPVEVSDLDSKMFKKITDDSGQHSQGFKLYTNGRVALEKGEWAQAISYLSRAQKLSPDLPEMDNFVAQARQQWRQSTEGQNEYYTLDALYDQAQHHLSKNDWDRAATLLERIVRTDAGYKDAYSLALDARGKADKEKAEQEKQAKLKELYAQAQHCWQDKNWAAAVDLFTQVVELDEGYLDSQQLLNEAIKQRDLQEAYQAGEKYLKTNDWPKAVMYFGKVTSIDGDYRDAAKLLALSRRQKQLDAWTQEAEDYLAQSQWEAVIEVLEENQVAQEREEARIHLHYAYAQFYFKKQNWEKVVTHLKQIIEARPNYQPDEVNTLYHQADEELRLQQQFNKAISHIDQQEWAVAKATLESIIQTRPDYPLVQEQLEQVNQEIHLAGLYDRALNALEFKQWAKAISFLKQILTYRDANKLFDEATKQLELATFYQDGLTAAGSGRWSEAMTAFERVSKIDQDYRDIRQELENARNKVALEQSFNLGVQALQLGQRHYDLEQLEQAVNHLEKAAGIDKRYRGVENRLHEAKRERFLLQSYQQGEEAYQHEQWVEAVKHWQIVAKDENEPDYHGDCAQRLAQALYQQRLADLYREANQHLTAQEWDNAIMLLEELQQEIQAQGYKDTDNLLAEARLQQELWQHYCQAEQLIATGQWDKAIQHLAQIQAKRADYRQADVERMLEEAETSHEAARSYEAGLNALKAEQWAEAVDCFKQAYKRKADFRDVETRLRQARQQETLHKRYQAALEAMTQETWTEAIEHLVAIQGIDPDFKDARQQLEQAEYQQQLAADYQIAQAHFEAERWTEARDAFADILAHKEAKKLYDEAQQQLDMAEKYKEAQERIEQAQEQAENWQLAVELLSPIVAWRPDYREAKAQLAEAQHQAELYNRYQRATVLGAKNEIPDLQQAIKLLGQITKDDLNYRDAASLKGQYEAVLRKKKQEKIKADYDNAILFAGTGNFDQVLSLLEQMIPLDKRYQSVRDEIDGLIQQCLDKYQRGLQLKADRKTEHQAVTLLQEYQQDKAQLPAVIQGILNQNPPK